MKTTAELEARIAELEEENATMRNAIEWFGGTPVADTVDGRVAQFQQLRARAFPPKFETVDVTAWKCVKCNRVYTKDPFGQCAGISCTAEIVELTGHYKRPIVAKVKHRIEVTRDQLLTGCWNDDVKFFVEWDER